MAYATFQQVSARAGRFAAIFAVAGKRPDQADVQAFLDECAAEIDAALASRGFTVPATGASASALVDLNAYGALARALASITGPEVEDLRAFARKMWGAALGDPRAVTREAILGSIRSGAHPVVALLEGMQGTTSPTAGNFWDDEPEYGSLTSRSNEAASLSPGHAPVFAKAQTL